MCKSIKVNRHINKRKDKTTCSSFNRFRESTDKMQHPFIIKSLAKVSTEGRHLNVIKPIYDKHTVNTVLKGNKRKAFLELWDKVRTPTLTICVQHTTGSPSHSNQARKKKDSTWGRKEAKLSLYADDMVLHLQSPEDAHTNCRTEGGGIRSAEWAGVLSGSAVSSCVCVCVCVCARSVVSNSL